MRKIPLLIAITSSFFCILMFQNFLPASALLSPCTNSTVTAPIGWNEFPKLFLTKAELGRAIVCARTDVKNELLQTAALLYSFNHHLGQKIEVTRIGIDQNQFLSLAAGRSTAIAGITNQTKDQHKVHKNFPGDARLAQRLSAASFFVQNNPSVAQNYRQLAKTILLHWATHTFKEVDMPAARAEARISGEHGLELGSNMVAFAAAYDLLAAGQQFTHQNERAIVQQWMNRMMELIALSNDAWMAACAKGTPFSYDGMSCERARGDNHITVGAAAVYALAVMTNHHLMMARAIDNDTVYKWGFRDRLGYVIYNVGDRTASPDRHGKRESPNLHGSVHTGEIYDRYRGHYIERARGLQLHRSFSYPFLSLGFLTTQALIAKRQNINLMAPVLKHNQKEISLDKAILFYHHFLKHYNPGEIIFTNGNRTSLDDGTLKYYTSITQTHCVSGYNPIPTDDGCDSDNNQGFLQTGVNDVGFTDAYYHNIYASARGLARNDLSSPLLRKIDEVLTPEKFSYMTNAFSAHIVPFEPAFFIE